MAAFGGAGGASNPNGGFGSGVSSLPGAGVQVAANPWDMGGLDPLPLLGPNNGQTGAKPKSAVENLLGEHSALVNLDSLVDSKKTGGGAAAAGGGAGGPPA